MKQGRGSDHTLFDRIVNPDFIRNFREKCSNLRKNEKKTIIYAICDGQCGCEGVILLVIHKDEPLFQKFYHCLVVVVVVVIKKAANR